MRPLQQPGPGPARELPTPADEVGLARVGAVAVEQDLGPDGPEPGRLDHPQGGGVAGRDLGEQHLAGRDQVAGGRDQQPPQPAVAPGRVDLEGHLPAPGTTSRLPGRLPSRSPSHPRNPGLIGAPRSPSGSRAATRPGSTPAATTWWAVNASTASTGPSGAGHTSTNPSAAGGDPVAASWSSRNSRWLTPRAYRAPAAPPRPRGRAAQPPD